MSRHRPVTERKDLPVAQVSDESVGEREREREREGTFFY